MNANFQACRSGECKLRNNTFLLKGFLHILGSGCFRQLPFAGNPRSGPILC